MDVLVGLAALLAAIVWYEWPRLYRFGAGKGEKLAFALFMAGAYALAAVHILGLELPNPTKIIKAVFGPLVPFK